MTVEPRDLAKQLRDLAARLELAGGTALRLAPQLEARGYPTSTLGDGTHSTNSSSTTETAALIPADPRWQDITRRLDTHLYLTSLLTKQLNQLVITITLHGDDQDPLPAGSGSCEACGRVCRPDMKPGDRIVSGYCPACYKAWERAGRPERASFEHHRLKGHPR